MATRIDAKVRVVYRLPGQRKDREGCGWYKGKNNNIGLRIFSLEENKGKAVTFGVPGSAIKSTEILSDDAPMYPPRTLES